MKSGSVFRSSSSEAKCAANSARRKKPSRGWRRKAGRRARESALSFSGACVEESSLRPPPATGKRHKEAMASRSVDLPLPFSPTKKVTGTSISKSRQGRNLRLKGKFLSAGKRSCTSFTPSRYGTCDCMTSAYPRNGPGQAVRVARSYRRLCHFVSALR